MSAAADSEPVVGWVAADVAEEYPELRLVSLEIAGRDGRSPDELKERLRTLSSRFHGAQALVLRTQPVPHAYRVFYRHVGLDPDADDSRTPAEEAVMRRLLHGGYKSTGRVQDAVTLALVETGVPVWALDADTLGGPIGIRLSVRGEELGREQEFRDVLPDGRMVVADADGALAVLFGDLAVGHRVTKRTERIVLFAVQVAGVPSIHVEEALWNAAEAVLPS